MSFCSVDSHEMTHGNGMWSHTCTVSAPFLSSRAALVQNG